MKTTSFKFFLTLAVAMNLMWQSPAQAASFPKTYCEMRMCEVRTMCMGADCPATDCPEGSFWLEISMDDSELQVYAVPSTKDSRVHFGDFQVDSRLSNDRAIVANSVVDNTLTNAVVELWTDGEPIGIAMTIQRLPHSHFVEMVYGFCGEEN